MKRTEVIEKITNLLRFGTTEEVVKCESAKLSDGTIIQWDGELSEGAALRVVAEDGNVMPVEDATHTLEDGTEITTVGGLVTKIAGPKTEVEIEEVEASAFEIQFANHLESFNSFIERFNAMEAKLAEITDAATAANESVETKFNKVIELVEAISNEPAVKVEPATNITYKKTPNKTNALEIFKAYQENLKQK